MPTPPLDPRTFAELVDAAKRRITASASEWTDLSPSDPGMVLLDAFAYLTESLIYRVNRLPDRAYDAFLRLIGTTRQPPSAAAVQLTFTRAGSLDAPLTIPRGTRVTVSRGSSATDTPVFTVASGATMAPGESSVPAIAYHADPIDGELGGVGTGAPGQVVTVRRTPLVALSGDDPALTVGVEMTPGERGVGFPTIEYGGSSYRVWRRVEDFSDLGDDRHVYVADFNAGTVSFLSGMRSLTDHTLAEQPTPLGEAPPAQRGIRLWYWVGGGVAGNVAENTLTVLKDPIAGVTVTNAARATGGRAVETVENARARGPVEFRRLERAVTARDFEDVARRSSAVARALAVTKAELWAHAAPGTVQVLLVPSAPDLAAAQYRLTPAAYDSYQTESARIDVQRTLDERRPLGTQCEVDWANVKTVTVRARVVIHRRADRDVVTQGVVNRLYQTINPVPTPAQPSGWPFGRPLRSWDVNVIVEAVPGVQYADDIKLLVDSAPNIDVRSIVPAVAQPRMWFASSGDALFRSADDGDGWEQVARTTGETIAAVRPHPQRPGLIALVTHDEKSNTSRVYFSEDCVESALRQATALPPGQVYDAAWIDRDGKPLLLLAADGGLFQLSPDKGASANVVAVTAATPPAGMYAISATIDARGETRVATAVQNLAGVYLSDRGGESGSFRLIGPTGKDCRKLAMQRDGAQVVLWAGMVAAGFEAGEGCQCIDITDTATAAGWHAVGSNWSTLNAGTCTSLAFRGAQVVAGSDRRGVLWLDGSAADASWTAVDARSGLPQGAGGALEPVRTVAVSPPSPAATLAATPAVGRDTPDASAASAAPSPTGWILVGGAQGVFRASDPRGPYENVSRKQLADRVTLPSTWLFCSGSHDITVVYEDAVG